MPQHTILAVDDSPDDLALLGMAIRKMAPHINFKTVDHARHALAYLSGAGQYADRQAHPVPTLMIVDLKMPEMNGFALLSKLPRFPRRPYVIVMSATRLQADLDEAKRLGADAFHTKPVEFQELCNVVKK